MSWNKQKARLLESRSKRKHSPYRRGSDIVGTAVRAEQTGQAMIEVVARVRGFENGDKMETRNIVRYSDAYSRLNLTSPAVI